MYCAEKLAGVVESLFKDDDRFSLLIEDAVYGDVGLSGLQLVANCLWTARELLEINETGGASSTRANVTEPQHAGLAHVKNQIHKLRDETHSQFVIAFQIAGTDTWNLAWSKNLDGWNAISEMATFIQGGMILDC